MFCSKCGNQLPDGTAVCPNCGEQFGQDVAFNNAPNPARQPVQQMNVNFQNQAQKLATSKLGVSCGVLAALLSFSGAFGWSVVFALIAGYIFLFENDQWLRSYTAKVTKIFVIYNIVTLAISLIKTCLSVLIDMDIFSNKVVDGMYKMSGGLSVINSLVSIVFAVILLVNAIKAYNMRNN